MISIPETFNVATYFVDRHESEGRGHSIAIECGEEQVTYAQLLERTNRVGNMLRQLGMRMEERVALLLLDSPEFLYSFFGAIKIGAVAVPMNTYLQGQDYEYLLNDSRARVLIVHDSLLPSFAAIPRERLGYLEYIVVAGGQGSDTFEHWMSIATSRMEAARTSKDDAAFWLYSSGSTGTSKACIHLHHDMMVCSELYAKNILHMTEQDRCYSVARLFFAYGLGNAGYYPLSCGATTILSRGRPEPSAIFANIERYRPTLFFSVPSNYAAMLNHHRDDGDGREFDLSSVRYGISAGESLPAPLLERFKNRFGVEILDALGSTEALHMVISNRPGEVRPGSSGKVIPGYEARLVDDEGRDVPTGEIGSLLIKGDSICAGYWNRHEKTKAAFEGAWFRTGDKYYQDEDGYFWYAGRADDLFKVNGRWLNPAEVESSLIAHPAVQEAAVVAREDSNQLTKPAAYVVLRPNFVASDELARNLQDWVMEKIGAYKHPRWIVFLSELPKTATGKLQRYRLRELQDRERDGASR